MKIGDMVFVRGYIDEIRKDTVIIRNEGGYFGTVPAEVLVGKLPSAQPEHKWETCFDCPLSHGCPKIKDCTNEQAIEYASQMPNDCPLSAQPKIIRCKECEHWDTTWQNDFAPNYHYCPLVDGTRSGDFYCADAERRTG